MTMTARTHPASITAARATSPSSRAVGKRREARGVGARHDWIELVAIFSREGELWTDRLARSGGVELLERADHALGRFSAGRLEEGWSALSETAGRWSELAAVDPSIGNALLRWRWSVVAYGHYRAGGLEEADAALLRSHRAITSAIEHGPCLLPLAHQCHELRIQRARVARAGARWAEVRRHLRRAGDMVRDAVPLCVLRDGMAIYYRTLRQRARWDEPPEPLASLLDPRRRHRLLTPEIAAVYALPGWLIPFPRSRRPPTGHEAQDLG